MDSDNDLEGAPEEEEAAASDGPWSILLCGLAGVIGMFANWLFGNQTVGGYITACAVFAALMYAILWAARRSSEDLED